MRERRLSADRDVLCVIAHKTLAVLLKSECVKAIEAQASSLENAKNVRQPLEREDDVASVSGTRVPTQLV